jgi:cystathionine beta-lyase
MRYDFDEIIDRRNTDSLKYDFGKKKGMPEGILPLWVADMDFKAPTEVIDILVSKSLHGIYGYSDSNEEYIEVLEKWFSRYFDWEINPKWLVKTPGVVYAVTTAVRAFTDENEGVLIQEPVYYPFKESIEINNRKVVINELKLINNHYEIDFENFEQKIIDEQVKLFILCSPHNPVGRVWTREELIKLGDICVKHGVLVVSDEIHADFIYPGNEHFVFAALKEVFAEVTITCTSPSKTFNLAGLQISNVFISNQKLKRIFKNEIMKTGYSQLNIMGIIACQASYEFGHEWLIELKEYLNNNLIYLRKRIQDELPKVTLVEPEGTYLVWLDFSKYGYTDNEINEIMIRKARVWLDPGTMFGDSGIGFQRINIACPRKILEKALDKIIQSF